MPVKYYQPDGKGPIYAVYGSSSINFTESLLTELAASQAREVQLRDALECYSKNKKVGLVATIALAIQQDTSALEAMIAKAGEVMRERCLFEADIAYHNNHCCDEIRAIPGVTLEDLK